MQLLIQPMGGGSAFAKGSANEVKTAEPAKPSEPKKTAEYKNTAEQGKAADSTATGQSTAIYAATSGSASSQSQTSAQQNDQITSSASNNAAAKQDDTVWTSDDFNISADGKTIGLTGINKTNGYPGLNAKGIAKLKKNPHIVIPDGVEVILNQAFIGKKTDKTHIEGVTLPDSLKVIEDGAFSWQKIKGTVVIPKNVIAIHPAAFLGNEIEKVVFKSTLVESGKFNSTDDHAYYVAGLGNRAFQANKIKEIDFQGNLTDYKFHVDSNEKQNPAAAPFSNQELEEITLTVGDEFKMPVIIKQNGNDYKILNMVLAGNENNHVSLEDSGYFKKENGKIVALKEGSIQTQCLFYDSVNGFRPVGTVKVTYNIIPMAKIYTVKFVDRGNANYASVQVKEGKSINDESVKDQKMPDDPTKPGFTFKEWNEKQDGTGKVFKDSTKVSSDLTVYSIFTDYPPVITVQNKTITEGDSFDLNSLVVSATDKEDGDLKSSVQRTNDGGFDNTKVGSYNVTFSVKDKGGATATAAATVTVTKKPTPPTPPAPTPEPESEPEPTPTPEPEPDIDWDDIPDIDLTPDKEPEPVPVIVAPAPILPAAEAEPEPAPAPSQPEQPEQQPKHVAKHLPKTGSTATPVLGSAIASLFAGLTGLAESFAATRKRRN
ncbi:leucine-rich repeat protein [Bifidobacteriaceae bacterium NR002]|nr:leucine-rich repeat protein [Bifidobacteriaceae bacterium NR002]